MMQKRPPDAKVTVLPAPVGGWNALNSLEDMPPEDAPILTNWVPTPTTCINRDGYTQFATGFSGQVETVMAFNGIAATKLLAACGGNIYDITAGGAIGGALQSGLNNDRWQYSNYTNSGGSYLIMVNGQDSALRYNGAAISAASITASGTNSAAFINVNIHQNRVWFVQKNSLNAWYLGTAAIQGAASLFPLTGVVQKGGVLVAMATWTIDAGYGLDDYAVFITSKGEILIYSGSDPTSSTTWGLIGDFQIGYPIGTRCYMKYAGDLLVITSDGLVPMSGAVQSSRTNPKIALSYKIQAAMSAATTIYGGNFGWQIFQYPEQNFIWVNVPVATGSQQQYVMNTINKAWCNFTGWDANCWELFNNQPYFGANGYVGQAWNSLADNGTNIQCDGLQSFNSFESPLLKQFTMMQPYINTNGSPNILAALNIDFSLADNTAALSFTPINYAVWDTGIWDTSVWGSDLNLTNAWQGVNGIGTSAGVRLKSATQGIQVQWTACKIVYRVGGIL